MLLEFISHIQRLSVKNDDNDLPIHLALHNYQNDYTMKLILKHSSIEQL